MKLTDRYKDDSTVLETMMQTENEKIKKAIEILRRTNIEKEESGTD